MAKLAFDKNKFLSVNKTVGSGEYENLDPGTYVCLLEDAQIENAKSSGRLQAKFTYRVSDEDDKYPNRLIWEYVGLEKDGEPWDKGYEILIIKLKQFGLEDMEAVVENFDEALEAIVGSEVRIKLSYKDNFQNVRVQKLINSPLEDKDEEKKPAKTSGTKTETNKKESKKEAPVTEAVEEVEELEEAVEEESDFKVGQAVQAKYKGELIVGKIHSIDEVTGVIKINKDNKLYPVAVNHVSSV